MSQLLSTRERETLSLLANGLTRQQVAKTLGLTIGTVSCYIGRINNALGADTVAHAVAIALRCGELKWENASSTRGNLVTYDRPKRRRGHPGRRTA